MVGNQTISDAVDNSAVLHRRAGRSRCARISRRTWISPPKIDPIQEGTQCHLDEYDVEPKSGED